MRIVRNLIRYTVGLPILLVETLMLFIGYFVAIIVNEEQEWHILSLLKEIWKSKK